MNGKTHQAIAIPAGVAFSLFQSQEQPVLGKMLEAAGAGLAASFGARLPDIWDLPTNPNHRSWAHSFLGAASVGSYIYQNVQMAQNSLREQAASHARASQLAVDPLTKILHTLCEWLYRFLSGCLVGFVVGYGSHLTLDAFTPRSLPWIS